MHSALNESRRLHLPVRHLPIFRTGSVTEPSGAATISLAPATSVGAKLPLVKSITRLAAITLLAGAALVPTAMGAVGLDSCEDNFVIAKAIESASDIKAFVTCAAEYASRAGTEEAHRAFNEDERWRYGPYYVFVHRSAPSGDDATSFVFPPEPWREGTERGVLIDNFGVDYYAEAHRIVSIAGAGWIYYAFTNFVSGLDEPKQSYLIGIDWDGQAAIVGAGIYRRDLPGTCSPSEVNAAALERPASPVDTEAGGNDEKLAEFVRCAAMEVEQRGYFAVPVLMSDPRWRGRSVFLFAVDPMTGRVTSSPFGNRIEGIEISGLFGGRDMAGVADAFGEIFVYYFFLNPATGLPARTVALAKRVIVDQVPMIIAGSYFPR